MGVAEWRLKINQPSLFQFVRKQKRKEIIKRERVGEKKKKEKRRRTEPHNPKCRVKLEKQRGELELLGTQKEKEILQSFDCLFVSLRPLPQQGPLTGMPMLGRASPPPSRGMGAAGIHPGVSPLQLKSEGEGTVQGKSARNLVLIFTLCEIE